jgi:hypothetical protein
MATYVTIADVNARIAHPGGFGASSVPTSTEVGLWMDEGEAMVLGVLTSIGASASYSASAQLILRSWIMAKRARATPSLMSIRAIATAQVHLSWTASMSV